MRAMHILRGESSLLKSQSCFTLSSVPFRSLFLQVVMAKAQVLYSDDFPQIVGSTAPVSFSIEADRNEMSMRIHHALYDAHTLTLIQDLINDLYLDSSKSVPSSISLRESTKQLVHFAQNVQNSEWAQTLSPFKGLVETTSLPDLRATTDLEAPRGFLSCSTPLSVPLQSIQAAAKAIDVSSRALLCSAWASVISGQLGNSFMMGETVSLRGLSPSLLDSAACLVATIPLPIVIDADTTRSSLMRLIHQAHQCSLRAPQVSSSEIRDLVQLAPDQALYACLFTNTPLADSSKSTFPLSDPRNEDISVEHAIACEVFHSADESTAIAEITYDPRRADRSSIEAMLKQLDHLVRCFIENPNARLVDHPWSDLEPKLLSRDAVPASAEGFPSTIDLILAQLSTRRDAVALEVWSRGGEGSLQPTRYTYGELSARVSAIARYLQEHTAPHSRIAVEVPRSIHTYAAMLAILATARTYVPIDQYLPPERKAVLLSESAASLLLCEESSSKPQPPRLDVAALPHLDNNAPLKNVASSEGLACIMFTSGSTGKPKAVGLSHSNFDAALAAFRHTFKEGSEVVPGSRFMARSAEAFDVHLLEGLLPLTVGATVVTAARDLIMEDLPGVLHQVHATHTAVVPSLFHHPDGRSVLPSDLPHLKLLIAGGERIHDTTITEWAGSGVPLLQAYGPTEATIGISCKYVQPNSKPGNVGRAFPGSTYLITSADKDLDRVLPRGQVGELVICGPQVALQGYLGFDTDSFQTLDGELLYRTGDLARMLKSGEVEIMGRKGNSQVKINGVRLELDEVSAVLAQALPQKRLHAVSILSTDTTQSRKKIISFVSEQARRTFETPSGKEQSKETAQVFASIRQRLPPWMLPAHIFWLDFLPLQTVSGKVDRSKLGAIWEQLSANVNASATDATFESDDELVQTLRSHVQKALGCTDDLPADQDLFTAGLDSLGAIRLASILRRADMHIASHVILAHPTLRELAQAMRERLPQDQRTSSAPMYDREKILRELSLDAKDVAAVAPTLPAQEAMIARSIVDEASTYVASLTQRMSCSMASLKSAW